MVIYFVGNIFQSKIKVLLIGNSGVGKSCILHRYTDNEFTSYYYNTIGVDFVRNFITLLIQKLKELVIEGKLIKMQIWDTAGQDRFRTMTSSYYRGAHGIMIIYDITDRESFENVVHWMEEIEKFAVQDVNKILIGNKVDLKQMRQISYDEGQQLANKYKIPFFEVSAKDDQNVEHTFKQICKDIYKRLGSSLNSQPIGMKLVDDPNQKKQEDHNQCCF